MTMVIRGITLLIFTISTYLLPMDPPTKKQEIIEWDNIQLQKALLGISFQGQPKETIFHTLILMPPFIKNGLRRTCTTFASLLSREKIQPFMLCKELCASKRDIQSLIIHAVHKNNRDVLNKLCCHSHAQKFFDKQLEDDYSIIGKSLYIGARVVNNEGNIAFSLSTYNVEDEYVSFINPLLLAIISRNAADLKNYLVDLPFENISPEKLDLYLCNIIQNNDSNSLSTILDHVPIICNLSESHFQKYIQLALYCCSDKVIKQLIELLQTKRIKQGMNNVFDPQICSKEPNHIESDFEDISKKNYIKDIILEQLPKLRAMHTDKREKLNYCLGVVLNNHLKELDLTSLEISNFYDRIKKEKELAENLKKIKNPKRKKYCSIQ